MRFHLISDNVDTLVGLRLAGIDGVVVHEPEEIEAALKAAIADEDIAIVLITDRLVRACQDQVYNLKLTHEKPLIVEIPDRHGAGRVSDSITRYVREAIGVKI